MKKKILVQTIFILSVLFVSSNLNSARAANLKFNPSSVTGSVGTNFDIKIDVDTGSQDIIAVDARILYPSNLIELQTIKDGTFLTIGDKDSAELGKIYINGIVPDPATSLKGQGTLATLTFKPKTDGSDKLTFVCIPGETAFDSSIGKNDINATDIIVCSENGVAAVTIGGGPTATPGPTATAGPAPTGEAAPTSTPGAASPTPTGGVGGTGTTPTPTALPASGSTAGLRNAFKLIAPGTILLLIGVGARMLL